METNQEQTPMGQTPQAPAAVSGGDLYSAIIADDVVPAAAPTPQKHISPFMKIVIAFMRLTFWMDLTKRSNEATFRALSFIWGLFMAVLYLSGAITFFLCLTSFIHLPSKLDRFFNENNIQYDTLEIEDYSLSQINITNLHDQNNVYQIPKVQIHSTFGDFLKNKILAIDAEGVRVNLKPSSTEKSSIQWMLDLFAAFNGNSVKKLDVDSLTMNNAVLTLSGKNITIPIAFSLTGDYTKEAQTAVLFSVNEEFIKAQGTLSLSGSPQEQALKLSITSGSVTLPNRPEEELQGEINAVVQNNDIKSADLYLALNYGHSLKEIKASLQESGTIGFDGEMSFSYSNTANEELAEKPLTAFSIKFKSLQIDEKGQISTSQPLELNIQRLENNDLLIEELETILNGDFVCQLGDLKCVYTLKKRSDVNLSSFMWNHKGKQIVFSKNNPLHLMPDAQQNLILQLASPSFQLDLSIDKLEVGGYLDKESDTLDVKAQNLQLSNVLAEKQSQTALSLEIKDGQIQTPFALVKGMSFSATDLFNSTSPVRFQAASVSLSSPLIKKPFSMQFLSLDKQSSIKLQVLESNMACVAKGFFDLFQMSFNGNFLISPITIQELPFDLQELSDYIPKNISNLSGKITLVGKNASVSKGNISGSLWLGLKNISFDIADTHVKNLNTVVALQSLLPLVSAPNQMFSIENIEDVLNLSNITATFQISNQMFRFFLISGQLADQILEATNSSFNLNNPDETIYFKTTKDFKMNEISSYLSLPNLILQGGTGALTLPLEVSQKGLNFSELTFKVNDTTLNPQTSEESDLFNLFTPDVSAYYIRGGKFLLTKGLNLEASLEGWLLPTKQKQSVETSQISLPYPLFKKGPIHSLPSDIYKRLNIFFPQGKNS